MAKASHAVLCTDSKTFELRQVQTSNSVHIIQPRYVPNEESGLPVEGLAAIAQCGSILEVVPSTAWPHQYLKDLLPIWKEIGDPNMRSKQEIFSNLPCSNGELEKAWQEMVAFEHNGSSMKPRAGMLLLLWKNILNTATAEGIDLNGPFHSAFLYENLDPDDAAGQQPRKLFDALVARMSLQPRDDSMDAMDVDCESR